MIAPHQADAALSSPTPPTVSNTSGRRTGLSVSSVGGRATLAMVTAETSLSANLPTTMQPERLQRQTTPGTLSSTFERFRTQHTFHESGFSGVALQGRADDTTIRPRQ